MPEKLSTSVQYLKSVGPKRAESFSKIGINTIQDLLFYFPTRYLDRTTLLNSVKVVQHLIEGYQGEVTIIGQVIDSEVHYYHKKQIFKVRMKDASGFFECVWFQGAKYFKNVFKTGDHFAISAKPVLTKYGHLQFVHPDFDRLAEKESKEFLNTGKIIPFYRMAKELRETNLGDLSLRRIIHQAVESFSKELTETLPDYIIKEKKLLEEEFLNGFFIEHNGLPCVFTLDYFDTTTSMNQSWFRGTFVCDKPIESLENLHIHVSLFSEYFETFHHFVTLTLKGKEWECIFDKEQQHYPDSVSAHYLGTLFSRFLV